MEMMNAMLVSSSTPRNLWGEPVLTTCFLQNRIPHKKTGKTPYKLQKGYLPNLKYLRVWGCLAKVMQTDPKKRKISSKTFDCLYIGYLEHSAAYRLLVLKSDVLVVNTIVETKNVDFFEDIFPFKSRQSIEINSESGRTILGQTLENFSEFVVEDLRKSKRQRKETSFGNDF